MYACRIDDLGMRAVARASHRVRPAHICWLLLCTCFMACYLGHLGLAGAYARTHWSDCAAASGSISEPVVTERTACISRMSLLSSWLGQSGQPNGAPCANPKIMVAAGSSEHTMTLPFGLSATVEGRLRCNGTFPAGAMVEIATFTKAGSAAGSPMFVEVAGDGSFRWEVTPGPSREIVFSYSLIFGERPAALTTFQVNVVPRISLNISPRRTHNRGTVIWRGRIEGGPYPSQGIPLLPEVWEGKYWQPFGELLAEENGTFKYRYTFLRTQRPTIYKLRIATPSTGAVGYDYTAGASRSINVYVR